MGWLKDLIDKAHTHLCAPCASDRCKNGWDGLCQGKCFSCDTDCECTH